MAIQTVLHLLNHPRPNQNRLTILWTGLVMRRVSDDYLKIIQLGDLLG